MRQHAIITLNGGAGMTVDEIKNYKQCRTPDYARLSSLVVRAKGPNRTMAQFADATGISTSTLSRILNLNIKKPLSVDMIIKIYGGRADQDDEYLLDLLVTANGMMSEASIAHQQTRTADRASREERRNREIQTKNAIIGSLVAGGYCISAEPATSLPNSNKGTTFRIVPDFVLYLDDRTNGTERTWNFDVNTTLMSDFGGQRPTMPARYHASNYFMRRSSLLLADAWTPDDFHESKNSFVFLDKEIYESFCKFLDKAKVHNEFSVILLDSATYRVVSESWVPGDYDPTLCVNYFNVSPAGEDTNPDEYEDIIDDILE